MKQILSFLRDHFRPLFQHRWIGTSGWIVLAIFIAGRIGAEAFRDLPRYDDEGMDAYHAVEQFKLRRRETPPEVVATGSSVSIWGVIPKIYERILGLEPGGMANLAVQGGVAFDGACMVRRNPEALKNAKIVILEVNPQYLAKVMDKSDRTFIDFAQRATFSERRMNVNKETRKRVTYDYFFPLWSVRRPFNNVIRNIADPDPLEALYPKSGGRLGPYKDWWMKKADLSTYKANLKVPPKEAARIIIRNWEPSEIEDQSLRAMIDWFQSQGILIILHQYPTHPLAVEAIRANPEYVASMEKYNAYVKSLGIPEDQTFRHFEISECGIPEIGMRDYSHFNQIGAEAYCNYLGKEVRKLLRKKQIQLGGEDESR